jgi:DNA-binding NtrC family response regulator
MEKELKVLIISNRMENRKTLLRTLEGLPLNTFSVSTIGQALEVLSTHTFAIFFCEERVGDGSYRERLQLTLANSWPSRFIVMLCTGEWEEYLEALKLGATEVIRCPLQPPDIDMVLIHAMREGRGDQAMHASA